MTAISVHSGNEEGRREVNDPSLLHVENMSNADLYCMTPPAYAMSAAEDEVSVDAQAMEQEKLGMPGVHYTSSRDGSVNMPEPTHTPESQAGPSTPTSVPNELPPVYFQQLTQDAAIASIRRCSILPNRPATWLVKRRDFALSPLAATVLVKEGIIKSKDLELISQSAGIKRDPNDPISGIAFATYDTVGDILLGLVEGPVEAAKQVTPILVKNENVKREPPNVRVSVLQESRPLMPDDSISCAGETHASEPNQTSWAPPQAEADPSSWEPRIWSDTAPQPQRRNSTVQASGNAAKEVALSTGKGFGRIVGASLKAPMTFTHGVTRGFHNLPKLYGDEVREYENVTDMKSGLSVSAKSFGYGIGDGLRDFFVQPIMGAQKEGAKGFAKGFGKGIGNVICKPASGACGLVSYSFVGVYKEIQGLKPGGKNDVSDILKAQGEEEYSQAAVQTRVEVVRRWCQMTMRQNGRG